MAIGSHGVSNRGQMALPAEARRRSNLTEPGAVEVADLGDAHLIVPAGRGGLRGLVRAAIDDAGGYERLAAAVAHDEPVLA
jgi:bifunctional DNA-binding transcriptional regulator/antitoxin component of YhaV-PrlF toxin-antitoxin module